MANLDAYLKAFQHTAAGMGHLNAMAPLVVFKLIQ